MRQQSGYQTPARSITVIIIGLMSVWHVAQARDDILITNAWINEGPPGLTILAGYLDISNKTSDAVVLTGASSPGFEKIEFHVTEIRDGVSTMRKQESVAIPAGTSFSFAPGHFHLMLFNPASILAVGDTVPLILHFDNRETVQTLAEVRRGATSPQHHH